MKPKGKRHNTIPIELGGQHSAGDPTVLPPGFVSLLRNYVIRPSRLDGRAPFVYDALDAVSGFAIWQDMTNEAQKTVAMCSADNKLYTKSANGTGYGTGLAGLTAPSRLTAYTNLLGKLWMAFDNGAGAPSSMAVYDGNAISTTPFSSAVNARSLVGYVDRLFLIYPLLSIRNTLDDPYNASGSWFATNCSSTAITNGTTTITRITPTASTGAFERLAGTTQFSSTPVSATEFNKLIARWDLRNTDGENTVPLQIKLRAGRLWGSAQAFVRGEVIIPNGGVSTGNGFRYRCLVAGTTGGVEPIWPTTRSVTVADNTVTWICDGTDIMGVTDIDLPVLPSDGKSSTYFVEGQWPSTDATIIQYTLELCFGNTVTPTLTSRIPVDAALRDGLLNTNPSKANFGPQVTLGDFNAPFYNKEFGFAIATVAIDAVIWSEISNPKRILARNTYPLTEIAGLATASIVSNGRLVVFKRSGMWIFKGTPDPYEPILPESPAIQVGCLGPRALDCSRDNVLYWIGEGHVYKMAIGSDAGPTEIDSPGMFEEIFNRSSGSWVESQSTYNMPLLAIDHANKDVWVYTQKGHIHIYSIQTGLWSYLDTNPTGTSAEVRAMIFDPASNRMLVSFGGAAATRFDETSNAQDTIVTGGGTAWNITNDIVPRPFELFAARYEASLLEVGVFHLATLQNGSLSIRYSYDRGVTYTTPDGYPVTSWIGNPRIRLPLAATGESVTIKISRTGAGGARNFSISKADALLRVHRGELTKTNAT